MENIIEGMQNEVIEKMEELEQHHRDKEIYTMEYQSQRDILDAKMDLLLEIERRLTL